MSMTTVVIRKGRAKPLWAGHPWVFAGSIHRVEGEPVNGDLVRVVDDRGRSIGCGFWHDSSALRVRILTRGEGEVDTASVIATRVRDAVALRRAAGVMDSTNLWRCIHGDGDGLPGVVADVVGDWVVVQLSVLGMERHLDALAAAISTELGCKGVWLRGGARHADREGLPAEDRLLLGEEPPETIWAEEQGVAYGVDLRRGAKTGHFSDQREN
ncbi:MAG: class I SAM-dependent rRNA methyltransferase, partial [Planctomycetota bacterium]